MDVSSGEESSPARHPEIWAAISPSPALLMTYRSGLEVGAIYILIGGPNVEMGLNKTKKMALNRMRYKETPHSNRFGSSKLMTKSRFRFEFLGEVFVRFFMADSSY
jgi:hypothetical protein